MKTSFADADSENPVTPAAASPAPASSALVEAKSQQLVDSSFFQNEGVEGCFDRSDIKLPRLALVHNTGQLSGELGFTPGNWVYNKEVDLGKEIVVSLVRMRRYLQEDLPFNSETMPQTFNSQEEARAAGFLDIREKKDMGEDHKYVKPIMDVDVLIEGKPEFLSFPLDFEGKLYALARWTLQGVAYSRVGKAFFSDSQFALRDGLATKFYKVSAKKEKFNANFIWVPRAQIAGRNTPEFVKFANSLRG